MDYAWVASKNPVETWGEVRSRQKKKRKTSRSRKKSGPGIPIIPIVRALWGFLVKCAIVAFFGYAMYSGYVYLTTAPVFAVRDVSLKGNQTLDRDQLLSWTGPIAGENIFLLNLGALSAKLAEHPWVHTVSVKRAFPETVQIEIKERSPFARIALDQIYIMDNYGILLGPDAPAYENLPLIVGTAGNEPQEFGNNVATEGVIRGLKTMQFFNRLKFFHGNPLDTVERKGDSRIVFLTEDRSIRVIMPVESPVESFKNFVVVFEKIGEEDKQTIEYIDLSFNNQVVVKYRKGADAPLVRNT